MSRAGRLPTTRANGRGSATLCKYAILNRAATVRKRSSTRKVPEGCSRNGSPRTASQWEFLVCRGGRRRTNVLANHEGFVGVEAAYSGLAVSNRERLKSIPAGTALQNKPVSSLDARRQVSGNQIRSSGASPTAGWRAEFGQ